MRTPLANFSAPVAAPVSACLTVHLSAKHPRPYAPQQVVIALSAYISFSTHFIYILIFSSTKALLWFCSSAPPVARWRS